MRIGLCRSREYYTWPAHDAARCHLAAGSHCTGVLGLTKEVHLELIVLDGGVPHPGSIISPDSGSAILSQAITLNDRVVDVAAVGLQQHAVSLGLHGLVAKAGVPPGLY